MTSHELIPTRHSLLRRMKSADDQGSWEEFFKIYWKLIYGFALKSGLTETEAQDVVQETIVTVSKNIHRFEVGEVHGSFKAWLLQTTRWRIADQYRKRPPHAWGASRDVGDTSTTGTLDRVPDPASLDLNAIWEADWKQNLAEAALEQMRGEVDPEQYQMFDLHVLRHWPAHKVAVKLGVKIGRVYFAKYKLSRLLRKVIKQLEQTQR